MGDVWAAGDAYEDYVGRWSRRVANPFLHWLDVPARRRWLDVGCGTGALTAAILALTDPAQVIGVDTSEGFLSRARAQVTDTRASFHLADARSLPLPVPPPSLPPLPPLPPPLPDHRRRFDAVVSGLALNFVPEPHSAVAEFGRVAAEGGMVAAYVWDYGEGMAMMRHFWDAATALDRAAAELDEGRRFPLCRPEPLHRLWTDSGLDEVTVEPIEVPTMFTGFDDYWWPFLGGQGPAPAYVTSLTEEHRRDLRDLLRTRLPTAPDGSIPLTARAWAVKGTRTTAGR
ncbi:class I SAM-dependent methyltransferase [Actinomadura sp. KC216]|uniref:class I SAM-dependent methyltransferase n=1 Tax=Actinomadura sp. KC216 TaxID=2530370 RepID=UPI0010485CC1|nr:class I SAM-dependent methyltransferase [Actinomadura sp. KC216]TDB74182.1 class I SAM-dependent methyltransferase [Actinomadura sp. KC216]